MIEPTACLTDLFDDPDLAAQYAEGPEQFMPGYLSVQRMASVLLRERMPEGGHVLVHGAGGGAEVEAFARLNPGWRFTGVEPAKAMLDEAAVRLAPLGDRLALHHGFIDDAPAGPFNGATSLLTLHFIEAEARKATVAAIVRRLKPGAAFVAVHVSFPQTSDGREQMLARHREFTISGGADPAVAEEGRTMIDEQLPVLEPEVDAAILREAGLVDVIQFFEAFTWRGWVGYAP